LAKAQRHIADGNQQRAQDNPRTNAPTLGIGYNHLPEPQSEHQQSGKLAQHGWHAKPDTQQIDKHECATGIFSQALQGGMGIKPVEGAIGEVTNRVPITRSTIPRNRHCREISTVADWLDRAGASL